MRPTLNSDSAGGFQHDTDCCLSKVPWAIHAAQSEAWCLGCGTPLGEEIAGLLPRLVALRTAAALELRNERSKPTVSGGTRILRGMVGMGAVFGAIGFAILGTYSAASLLFFPTQIGDDLDLLLAAPFVSGGIGFGLGVLYAGLLAFLGRGRSLRELSLTRVTAAGAVVGLAPVMVVLASPIWGGTVSASEVLGPIVLFPPLSAAVATATLLLARRAKPKTFRDSSSEEP